MKLSLRLFALGAAIALLFGLVGCSGAETKARIPDTTGTAPALVSLKIGTLPTDDLLPLWVAEKEGLLSKAGLKVEIVAFQSAQEQIAAMSAGEIDGMMTDMLVPAQLTAGGVALKAVNRIAPARIGVVASPKSGVTTLAGLANIPVAAASPTITEYIVDKTMTAAGVSQDKIKYVSIPKVPVRFEMLMADKVKAAALPWTFCGLAASKGATVLVAEKDIADLTSTVLAVSDKWLAQDGADATLKALFTEWDKGVDMTNADAAKYLPLLVEKANLPAASAANYPMRTYDKAQLPAEAQVNEVINWMVAKGYLKAPIAYADYIHAVK